MIIKNAQGREVKEHTLPDMVIPKPQKLIIKARKNRVLQRKAVLDETRQQLEIALETINNLENELLAQREARFQEGFDAGRDDGYGAGVKEVEARIQKFTELVQDLQSRQAEVMRQAESFLANFAFRMVEKIVGGDQVSALKLDKKQLMRMVDEVIQRFVEAPKIVFRVNRQALSVLEESRAEIAALLPDAMSFTVAEDVSLKPGDCIIESDFGVLDGRIETKLKQIEKLFGGAN